MKSGYYLDTNRHLVGYLAEEEVTTTGQDLSNHRSRNALRCHLDGRFDHRHHEALYAEAIMAKVAPLGLEGREQVGLGRALEDELQLLHHVRRLQL